METLMLKGKKKRNLCVPLSKHYTCNGISDISLTNSVLFIKSLKYDVDANCISINNFKIPCLFLSSCCLLYE